MPGTLPVNTFNKVTIKNNTPTATSVSISGRRQSKQLAAQFWTLDCEYASLDRTEAAQVMAFLNKQNNSLSSFQVVVPQYGRPNGTIKNVAGSVSNAISVRTAASIGALVVYVACDTIRPTDFTSRGTTATGAFRAGDFVKFSNHNKMYQLTEDATVDSSGYATMQIFPGLYTAVTTSDDLYYWDVPFTVFNTSSTQEYELTVGDTATIALKLHEAI